MSSSVQGFEKKKIFISRNLTASSPLLQLSRQGHELEAQSLIRISPIRFTYTPKTDWIFFSSKNAIFHFFSQHPEIPVGVKYGVMGDSSSEFLQTYGIRPDFAGTGVDVTKIAKDFAARVGNETVLLPQAIDSLQTIQKQLTFTNNCSNLFVYKTSLKTDFPASTADILVFTSPSNARAYFEKYKLTETQQVVAIGSTTLAALKTYGVKQATLPDSFNEQALLDTLQIVISREEQPQE